MNSWASLFLPVKNFCTRRFAPSADSRSERNFLFCCRPLNIFSQPEKSTRPVAWSAPRSSFRRERSRLRFFINATLVFWVFLSIGFEFGFGCLMTGHVLRFPLTLALSFNGEGRSGRRGSYRSFRRYLNRRSYFLVVPTGDHGAHVVQETGGQHHEHVTESKKEKAKRENEMNRARRLPPGKCGRQPIEGDVQLR